MRQHAHQFAGLELGERRLLRVDLVAEDPQMPGVQTAVFVALQAQRRQLRRGTRFRAWERLKVKMAGILTDADAEDAAQSPRRAKPARICCSMRTIPWTGIRGARKRSRGPARGQAHSAVGGLFGVSLVPRHGARIIRGPRAPPR